MMETGWVKVSSTDVLDLHYQYQAEKEEAEWVEVSAADLADFEPAP